MSFTQSRLGNPRRGRIKVNSNQLRRAAPKLAAGVVVLIALLYVASSLLSGNRPISPSQPATFLINSSTKVVAINGSQYAIILDSITPKEGRANIYLERSPIFLNRIYNVTLSLGNVTHVAVGTNYSDIGVALNLIAGNSIRITVTAISTDLGIKPDSEDIRVIPPALLEGTPYAGSGGNSTAPAAGNTTASNSTKPAAAAAAKATSANQTAPAQDSAELKAVAIAEADKYYPLMLNYSNLYNNSANCTEATYNSSYLAYYSKSPGGPTTYANVSLTTPYSMYSNVTGSGSEYNMTFYAKSRTKMLDGAAVIISVNTLSGDIVGNYTEGIFLGSNYTSLKSGYVKVLGIGNACGIYVA
jgi:hypothetical protein